MITFVTDNEKKNSPLEDESPDIGLSQKGQPVEKIIEQAEAENEAQAREYVEKHYGLVIGSDIHSSLPDDEVNWEFPVHPDTKIGKTTRIKP